VASIEERLLNVVDRNETERLPLQVKLNILLRITKFWIHLESFPDDSIAKQFLIISNQLAKETKPSFLSTVDEIINILVFRPFQFQGSRFIYHFTLFT